MYVALTILETKTTTSPLSLLPEAAVLMAPIPLDDQLPVSALLMVPGHVSPWVCQCLKDVFPVPGIPVE